MSDLKKRKKTRSPTAYLVYGTLFFAFFLLLYFPASRAYEVLENQVPALSGPLELTGLEGPWFAGKARQGSVARVPVRQVSWSLKPSFSGLVQADVSIQTPEGGYFETRVGGAPGSLTCNDLRARVPLQLLRHIFRRFGWEADGSASLAIDRLALQNGYPNRAEGTIDLSRLRIVNPGQMSLGDFKVELTSNDREIQATLRDQGGPLSCDGTLNLKNDGSYSFSGTFSAREEDLKPVLRQLGRADKNGTVTVRFSGRLSPLFS